MTTDDMRDCLLQAIRRQGRQMGTATLSTELPLHEVNVRKRMETGRAKQWSVADFAALMAYERDMVGTRTLVDAVLEADGRDLAPIDPTTAERTVRELASGFADELSAILRRLETDGLDAREAAETADELEPLVARARLAIRTLRARARQTR